MRYAAATTLKASEMDSFTFKSFDEYAYVSLQDFLSENHPLYYMILIKLPSGIERRTPP